MLPLLGLMEEAPTRVGVSEPQTQIRRLSQTEMEALRQRAAAQEVEVGLGPDAELADQIELGQ